MYRLGFIGTGNMGAALIHAAANSGYAKECLLTNRTKQKAEQLAQECGCTVANNNSEVAQQAYYIMLGVKPHLMAGVLREIAPVLKKRQQAGERFVLVSMAAALTIEMLKEMVDGEYPVLRIMPNTPCAIGRVWF